MRRYLIFLVILTYTSCIEPYDFEVVNTVEALVVDASLTNETTAHYVKLSKSVALTDSDYTSVSNATVWVENDNGDVIHFEETEPGLYQTDSSVAGVVGNSYTLFITTNDGNKYASSAEILLPPTPIDSIYGEFKTFPSSESGTTSRGVQFFLNASNNTAGATSYYRYEFEQDYAIKMPYVSQYEWNEDQMTYAPWDTLIDLCYQHIPASGIFITTTTGQSENKVSEYPLVLVEESDPYLLTRYSLVVRQYTISPGAFTYYKTLKEVNEASGSFFDQQKGSVIGNIKNITNASEQVLGYFEVAGVSTTQRVFDPVKWNLDGYNPYRIFSEGCSYDDAADTVSLEVLNLGGVDMSYRNMYYITTSGTSVILVPKTCSDCRLYGTLKKPEFWD